jgi:hypothetical protein
LYLKLTFIRLKQQAASPILNLHPLIKSWNIDLDDILLKELPDAIEYIETMRASGKVVVTI